MMINKKCPRCGSDRVQLSLERSKHGCFWFILLGWVYLLILLFRWVIGLLLFVLWDWWMAIIHRISGKGHIWQCRKWFAGTRRVYYCHDCGCNFRT